MKKTIELFAGTASFSKAARKHNWTTWTTDIKAMPDIDHVCDFMSLTVNDLPYIPDILWASPPCETFSVAAGKHHYNSGSMSPKTEKAKIAVLLLEKLMLFIKELLAINPNMIFYIENPVGRMAKLPIMTPMFSGIEMRVASLSQCQYGRVFRKNTHLFTNDFVFVPKTCKSNSQCHHINLKNGVKKQWATGNIEQQTTRYYYRAMLPENLFFEIFSNYTTPVVER